MSKVTGIKSVDFKVTALGHGVVNWNGSTEVKGSDNMTINNHNMPKLRGYTNLSGNIKKNEDNDKGEYNYRKSPQDVDFSKTPLYISQNCVRHFLFKDQAFDMHFAKEKGLAKALPSLTGLVRGYMVPTKDSNSEKRASPMLMEDFVDELGNGNFEQFTQAGERDNTSIHSKTTFGDTKYTSYGSISIEHLRFISLDKKFDRAAMNITAEGEGEAVAESIQAYIETLNHSDLSPAATYHDNYIRKGTIYEQGEAGVLLNDDAVQLVVDEVITRISELSIRQSKAYMYVDDVIVDYNDSHKMMRIKRDLSAISEAPQSSYADYYYEGEVA